MKIIWIVSVIVLCVVNVAFGNNANKLPIPIADTCANNLTQFCLYGYTDFYSTLLTTNREHQIFSDEIPYLTNPRSFNLHSNESVKRIIKRNDHLEEIKSQMSLHYHKHEFRFLGQILSPLNIKNHFHHNDFRRFEGLGLRMRI